MIVRPLPARFQEATRSKEHNDAQKPMGAMLETHYHVIIKSLSIKEETRIRRTKIITPRNIVSEWN